MNCLSCESPNPDTASFCGACGTPLVAETSCQHCGSSNPQGQRFCNVCGRSLKTAPAPQLGATPPMPTAFSNGRYPVLKFLGEGSKKRVYLARDTQLNRDVAIGVIKNDGLGEPGLVRVRREVQAMGELGDHPHIVTVYDILEQDEQLYIVSQYLAGGTVESWVAQAENQHLPIAEAVRIGIEICRGLEHAHSRGVIHRDLKPSNVWLTQDGTAKLGDFGLAVSLDRSRLTQEGLMVGTVAYMPPEQALGRAPDVRSDLYALGAMLYELVTGRPPFVGDGVVAVISQHINTAPVAPSWHNAEVPKPLETLILKLLEKDPQDRLESAAAVEQALQAISTAQQGGAVELPPEHSNPLDRLAGGIFVGREHEVGLLRKGVDQALAGSGRVLMLVGEPGIGKTRTAEEIVTYARLRGAEVLWGRCYEGEGAPAYWPWVQIVRASIAERDAEKLRSWMGSGATDIAAIAPEVREVLPDLPEPPELEAEAARFRLFDSITTFLKNFSNEQPLVLVLDDLHWADESSLLLLQFLVREIHQSRLLLLGTYRDVELKRGHPLSETLAILTRAGLSERVLLRGLSRPDVARFVAMSICDKAPPRLAEALYTETEGNPFFLHEVVRLLISDGRLEDAGSLNLTIPQSVRDVIGRRLNQLSESCNEILSVASVIGREFDLSVLERSCELEGDGLLETIEEATAARVVTDVADSVGRYRFLHALVRETLYEELSTPRRVRIHRRVGEVLEDLHRTNPEPHLAELAHHFFQSIQAGSVDKAVNYAVAAAESAVSQRAYEEAVGHYDRALQASELQEPLDDAKRCELYLALGDSQRAAGNHDGARETFERAAGLAQQIGSVEQLAHAAVGYARLMIFGFPNPRAIELIEQALAGLGKDDSALHARLLGLLALVSRLGIGRPEAEKLALQAVEMARRVGDRPTLTHVLDVLHLLSDPLCDPRERLAVPQEMLEVAESIGDYELMWAGRVHVVVDLMVLGDWVAIDRQLEALAGLVQIMRQPLREAGVIRIRIARALLRGRFEEAEQLLAEAERVTQRVQAPTVERIVIIQKGVLLLMRGELDQAISGLEDHAGQDPDLSVSVILAFLHAEAGRDAEARAELDRVLGADLDEELKDFRWTFALSILARACVLLGDTQRAEFLYERLTPLADRMACLVFFLSLGSVEGQLGLLATILGRWDDAERHFEAAIRRNEQVGARPFLAYARYDYAQMCLARGRGGDRDKALALVNQALEEARSLGMKGLVEDGLGVKLEIQGIARGADIRTSIEAVASVVESERPDLQRHASPDGTVTLMFSDMEGFTAMTERLGDREALRVIQAHHGIVRSALKEHAGYEVELQGDGFLLAFSSPGQGVECAIAIQRAFSRYNEEHVEQPIRVRIGLHSGEAIRDANKFFGKTVILASRIADQARPTEILVSLVLKELVESSRDLRFDEGRDLNLKGLAGTYRAHAVSWT
ncbi:MAG: protein kinase [Myxococcales bacterium]|nr:protein kinase [Myxococcales bacterium]